MTRTEAWRVYADVLGCEPASLATVLVAVANKADPLDVALAVTRAVRETIGGE